MIQNRKKHRIDSHPIIHCHKSEGVREVSGASEQVSAAERASEASSAEQANERMVRANERTDERVARYLRLTSWLFWIIVEWAKIDLLPRHKNQFTSPAKIRRWQILHLMIVSAENRFESRKLGK